MPSNFFERSRAEWMSELLRKRVSSPVPEPIPGLPRDAIPARLKSFDLKLGDADLFEREAHDVLAEAISKVLAEDRRMRRMLPPAPYGYEWHADLQACRDDARSFIEDSVKLRIVYTLRAIPPRYSDE